MTVAVLIGGGCDLGGPLIWSKIFWITSGSVISAMILIVPTQSGQRVIRRRPHHIKYTFESLSPGKRCNKFVLTRCFSSRLVCFAIIFFSLLLLFGTISFLIFALGWRQPRTNTPWYRTRLWRGRGTSAASLLRKSKCENRTCIAPSLNGFFSSYWICALAPTVSRSRQIAGLVTYGRGRLGKDVLIVQLFSYYIGDTALNPLRISGFRRPAFSSI